MSECKKVHVCVFVSVSCLVVCVSLLCLPARNHEYEYILCFNKFLFIFIFLNYYEFVGAPTCM